MTKNLYYLTNMGDFMKLKRIGVDFPHKKGEFCQKSKFSQYTICCFLTPFLYQKDGKLWKGQTGDLIINTPNKIVYHGPRPESEEGFVNDWMHVVGDDVGELLEKYPVPLNEAFHVDEWGVIRKYFSQLLLEYNSEITGSSDMMGSIFTQMMITLHRAYKKQNISQEDFYRISAMRREIITNPGKKWTLKEMAGATGYSVSRFSELYKQAYHISPINDVIEHRISLAKMLLLSGQASVSYVADTCGFSTINYFSKYFKAATGYPPSEYSKKFMGNK